MSNITTENRSPDPPGKPSGVRFSHKLNESGFWIGLTVIVVLLAGLFAGCAGLCWWWTRVIGGAAWHIVAMVAAAATVVVTVARAGRKKK